MRIEHDADPCEDEYDAELYDTTRLPDQPAAGRWIALIALVAVLVGSRILPLP